MVVYLRTSFHTVPNLLVIFFVPNAIVSVQTPLLCWNCTAKLYVSPNFHDLIGMVSV